MLVKWKQLQGGIRGIPGISDEQRAALHRARAAVIEEAQNLPTAATHRGKRSQVAIGRQQGRTTDSTDGDKWDVEDFEDLNYGTDDCAGDQDDETGNNADNELDANAALDESNDTNRAFDAKKTAGHRMGKLPCRKCAEPDGGELA
ncbi:hypothetical protein BJ741DRAFT_662550 [Chytriomyces cf. hyalinus JEL632]|nr:hypothetical protein BJ741DRAFT_662550 [Chytriomyces cf. hyalinus JEL632]